MRQVRTGCLQIDAGSPKNLYCPVRSMERKLKNAGASCKIKVLAGNKKARDGTRTLPSFLNICKRNIVFKRIQFPENTKGWNPL
ncbi:hypothetical protein DW886_19155 [Enterocloster aldenensis]|nr:hypothetical protein DW886_19155 [Enterocloster aldenensis]